MITAREAKEWRMGNRKIEFADFRKAAGAYMAGEMLSSEFGWTISDFARSAMHDDVVMADLAKALCGKIGE